MSNTLPPIIDPIPTEILKQELHLDLMLRHTNRANNEIYTFHAAEAPHVMQELGRLREEAFRYYGGGSGKSSDVDDFDLMTNGYRQLIVWDPSEEKIIGGYRYILGKESAMMPDGEQPALASAEIFRFMPEFMEQYLPYTIELGRSFVRLEYQQARLSPKSLFALDNLWDGLGALSMVHDDYHYFFGKVTIYRNYNVEARDLILYFLRTHFAPKDRLLVEALHPIVSETSIEKLQETILGEDLKSDYLRLNKAVRALGVNIPPLINAYIGLSSSMSYFGTSINPHFLDVEESAILVPFKEIAEEKRTRHMKSFLKDAAKRVPSALLQRLKEQWSM